MNERPSHMESYQAMTPRERNVEMKKLFDLLPDFTSTYGSYQNMDSREKEAEYERVNELIERRSNSKIKKDLFLRLKSLLSFSSITNCFKLDILDAFNEDFGEGITRRPNIVGDKIFPSGAEFYARLFHWDNPEDDGIFGENAKEIDKEAYRNIVWFCLFSMQMAEEMGLTQEDIEDVKKDAEGEGRFFEIAKQFEQDEGLRKLEIAKKANNNLKKVLGEDQERIERARQWKIEFEKLYGEEP